MTVARNRQAVIFSEAGRLRRSQGWYFAFSVVGFLVIGMAMSTGFAPAAALQGRVGGTSEATALRLAKKHHGLPLGVHVPSWVHHGNESAYLLPPGPSKTQRSELSSFQSPGTMGMNDGIRGGREERSAGNELGLRCTGSYCPQPPLRYRGGLVQHEPNVHLIFWGSNWNVSPGTTAHTDLMNLFQGLSNSPYQEVLTQYFDATGRIAPTVKVSSYIDTRSAAPTGFGWSSPEAELAFALKENPGWTREANAQFAIFPAPGSTYEAGFTEFCAYHAYDSKGSVYLVVPYAGDEPFQSEDGCQGYYGKGDPAKATSLMASHEYTEAATDPIWDTEPGWMDYEGYENADICSTPYDELPNGTFVQGTYDDHQNACSLGDEHPPQILALTEPATHVTEHAAKLHGTINAESLATTYYFEYGTTTGYGTKVPKEALNGGSGRSNVSVEATISGLTIEQVYHYRVVATNSSGTTYGEDQTVHPSRWLIRNAPRGEKWGPAAFGGVSCTSTEFCMAVGGKYDLSVEGSEPNQSLSYELHGGEWVERLVPAGEHEAWPGLSKVSCFSSNACTAVGNAWNTVSEHPVPVIVRWNGKEWRRQELPLPKGTVEAELNGVSCPTATECFAVGYFQPEPEVTANLAAIWKAGSWEVLPIPTGESFSWSILESVSCPSTSFCVAVGFGGGLANRVIAKWNGVGWTLQEPAVAGGALWGVSCTSSTFCAAVNLYGYTGGPEIWNGSTWSEYPGATTPDLSGYGLEAVSCRSSTYCVATGFGGSNATGRDVSLAEEWNGTSWNEQATPRESERMSNNLNGVSCVGIGSCMAVGGKSTNGQLEPLSESREMPVKPIFSSNIGSGGSGSGQFNFPRGIAVEPSGDFWVADGANNRIEKFNSKGEFVSKFGSFGTGNGQFNTPVDIALDSAGNLWITDAYNCRVEEFNSKGEYLSKFGTEGLGPGQFVEPSGIAIDASGNIWVSDHRYYRVEEFNSKGEYIRTSPVEFGAPEGIAVDAEGHLWVADADLNRVVELSSSGAHLGEFGTYGNLPDQFEGPSVIDIRPAGELLVADATGRIQEFSALTGEYLTQFGAFASPDGLATSEGGVTYVANSGNNRIERWAEMPMAVTNAAEAVGTNQATLNGTVNPGGSTTTYQFEYGTTTAYGSGVPVSPQEAGSGTTEVQVSAEATGLQEQTTYHYRLVSTNSNQTNYGKDRTFTTSTGIPAQLKAMATTDPFNGTTSAVSNFGTNWTALGWAAGSPAKGDNSTSGWHPSSAYPTVNGASFNPTVTDLGTGTAAVATMATNPSLESRYFSIWLDMPTPGSTRAGYELRFTDTTINKYSVALSRWKEGSQTTLASQTNYSFSNGNSFAVVDQGSTVSAWVNTGSGFTQLLSGGDSTFSGGSAAVEGSGNITRLTNFKVAPLLNSVATTDAALKALPVRDAFATNESPLSGGGAWAALAWDNGTSGHNTGQVSGGWGPYDAYSTINGAYWQKATFADTGAGDGVAATLTANPANTSRYFSLWLNASSPGSARSGYELRFTETSSGNYEVVEAKWVSGTKTVLATKTGYSFAKKSQLALVDKGGVISTWTSTGLDYTQLLTASDTTYTSGYSGLEGSGNITRLTDFRSGPLSPL